MGEKPWEQKCSLLSGVHRQFEPVATQIHTYITTITVHKEERAAITIWNYTRIQPIFCDCRRSNSQRHLLKTMWSVSTNVKMTLSMNNVYSGFHICINWRIRTYQSSIHNGNMVILFFCSLVQIGRGGFLRQDKEKPDWPVQTLSWYKTRYDTDEPGRAAGVENENDRQVQR